jgi:nickel/cobalt transporter (NicO) family protein
MTHDVAKSDKDNSMKWLYGIQVRGVRLTIASALLAAIFSPVTRADTVASLLGNFTINQYCGLQLSYKSLELHYVVVYGQLPALRELHLADVNGDGVTTQTERDEYVRRLAPEFASKLHVIVDGVAVPLRLTHWTSSLPTEQGGFSLRLDATFSGALPVTDMRRVHKLEFENWNYQGRIGWKEIAVQPIQSIRIFNTDAYATSLTAGLTEAVKVLPVTGPADETSAQMSFTDDSLPVGARPIQPRSGSMASSTRLGSRVGSADTAWLQIQTRRLIDLISTPTIAPHVAIVVLLTALVLGAFHALSPGHGKTIVGAYLIGSRGTPKHAAFLGLTVTITHTLGVFTLGFATLFASRFVVPERLFPILSLASGLLIFGMGTVLIAQRWRAARLALARRSAEDQSHNYDASPRIHAHEHHTHHSDERAHQSAHSHAHGHGPLHLYGHDHARDHEHAHAHAHYDHEHGVTFTHSHGGSEHSHLPVGTDGTQVTWRSLLALGISGGLIPCPSAMVLLLAAVALNKTGYGLLLVLAFSVGLALTLTMIGLVFLYARKHLRPPRSAARWAHLLPIFSAGIITLVGAVLCFNALQGSRL